MLMLSILVISGCTEEENRMAVVGRGFVFEGFSENGSFLYNGVEQWDNESGLYVIRMAVNYNSTWYVSEPVFWDLIVGRYYEYTGYYDEQRDCFHVVYIVRGDGVTVWEEEGFRDKWKTVYDREEMWEYFERR